MLFFENFADLCCDKQSSTGLGTEVSSLPPSNKIYTAIWISIQTFLQIPGFCSATDWE